MTRRVVITGTGVISSIGLNTREFWGNSLLGKSTIEPIPKHWRKYSEFESSYWSPLPKMDYSNLGISKSQLLRLDPVSLNIVLASLEALESAGCKVYKVNRGEGYKVLDIDSERSGVYMGTGVGGIHSLLQNHSFPVLSDIKAKIEDLISAGVSKDIRQVLSDVSDRMIHPRRVNPFIVSMLMPNAVSANVGLFFGLNGPNLTFAVACASGTVAIGKAYKAIKNGDVDMALAGGSEYLYDHYGYIFRGFDVAGTLAKGNDQQTVNRPFDKNRSGFLFSEGASAAIVLEELEVALARGASVVAEITGYGESFEAHNIMRMGQDMSQIERMILQATRDAGVHPEEFDYVNSHGTGTANNDDVEARVLTKLFEPSTLVNSTKSLVGHTIGASGALEVIVSALSLKNQTTHACKNLTDPISNLNFVTEVKSYSLNLALSQSFAFGGHSAGLVLRRYVG